jgi:type VI protein secretion system component VasK
MDMEQYIAELVIAIISMVGTMSGSYFANRKSTALVAYRLEQLEKKQDIHNGVIDRVYKLEKGVALNKEDIKVANHRIEDLERKE